MLPSIKICSKITLHYNVGISPKMLEMADATVACLIEICVLH